MPLSKPLPAVQPFALKPSPIQGLGGFATRDIRRGERVGEYVGERISQSEADRRYDDDAMDRHHTFLFTVSSRTAIDAAVGGNDTRFINHSCDPNCEAVIEGGRVFIDARRPIPAGSELFYDYAYEREPDAGPTPEAQYPCSCGSPKCRKTILAPLPPSRRHSAAHTPRSKTSRTRSSPPGRANSRRPTSGARK